MWGEGEGVRDWVRSYGFRYSHLPCRQPGNVATMAMFHQRQQTCPPAMEKELEEKRELEQEQELGGAGAGTMAGAVAANTASEIA